MVAPETRLLRAAKAVLAYLDGPIGEIVKSDALKEDAALIAELRAAVSEAEEKGGADA